MAEKKTTTTDAAATAAAKDDKPTKRQLVTVRLRTNAVIAGKRHKAGARVDVTAEQHDELLKAGTIRVEDDD
jgi:hypothetical protein